MFNFFKPKVHQHKVVVTYITGTTRKKYEGTDNEEAKKTFLQYKAKWFEDFTNVFSVVWYRDGDTHEHV